VPTPTAPHPAPLVKERVSASAKAAAVDTAVAASEREAGGLAEVSATPGRALLALGGLLLVGSSFVPLANSLWVRLATGIELWFDLVPLILGVVGLTWVLPRRIPTAAQAALGLVAGALIAIQLVDGVFETLDGGIASLSRFALVAAGCLCMLVAALLAFGEPAVSSGSAPD
jgi:hypothetical protein